MNNTFKGIVFEKKNAYSIFMTPEGLFQRGIPLSTSVEVGEEASFRPYLDMRKRRRSIKTAWSAPVIAMAASIVLFFSVLLPSQSTVSAFVQIDINPSIELGIDHDGEVQLFRGLNEDGEAIKRDISFWKGKPLSWVLQQIVNQTESISTESESIEIITIYKNDKDHVELEKVIDTAITATPGIATEKQEVKVIEASIADREAANTEGISVKKYRAEIEMKNTEKKLKQERQLKQQDEKTKNTMPADKNKDIKDRQDQKESPKGENPKENNGKKENNNVNQKDNHAQKEQKMVDEKNPQTNEKGNSSDHNKKSNEVKDKENNKNKEKEEHKNNRNNDNKNEDKDNENDRDHGNDHDRDEGNDHDRDDDNYDDRDEDNRNNGNKNKDKKEKNRDD